MNITYKFETRINGKNIQCRAFTLEEYANLIAAKKNGTIDECVKALLRECANASGLNKQESELLIVILWAHSIGEVNHEVTWNCTCGRKIPVPLNYTHAQIDPPEDLWYDLKGFKIKFKYPNLFDDSDIPMMISKCIDYIVVGNEQIYFNDLNDAEIDDLYSAITTEDVVNIKNMLLKPQVQLAVPITCECGISHIHVIKGLKEFFKIMS